MFSLSPLKVTNKTLTIEAKYGKIFSSKLDIVQIVYYLIITEFSALGVLL